MTHSVPLLVAILVSLQCSYALGQIDSTKVIDNNIQPNVAPAPRRRLRNFVHIQQAPPESVRLEPGSKVVLTCEVMGKPSPSVQWMKNGEPIADYDEENNYVLAPHPSSAANLISKLVISSANSGDVYTCVATSVMHQETASTTIYTDDVNEEENLLTLQKLFRLPSQPIISIYYSDVFQNMGTDIVLPCRVDSDSKVEVIWEDTHNNIIYGNPRMRVLPSGDLLVTSLRWSDMGNFTCIAKNLHGKDVITTFVYPVLASKV